jgi:hypothetical protein
MMNPNIEEIKLLLAAGNDLEANPNNASKQQAFNQIVASIKHNAIANGWQPPQVLQHKASGEAPGLRSRVIETAYIPTSEIFEMMGLSLFLHIEPQTDGFSLTGIIQLEKVEESSQWMGGDVEVYSGNHVISTATIDEQLEFTCLPPVPSGQIELRLFSITNEVIIAGPIQLVG